MSEDGELLIKVFTRVVEDLAFMFTESPEESDEGPLGDAFAKAYMDFRGPFNGTLSIVVPESMCAQIAANVLGLEPDDELFTRQPYDALKELLNVTCGNLLTAMAGEEPIFDLNPPEVALLDRAGWDAFKENSQAVLFLVEDEPVLLSLKRH